MALLLDTNAFIWALTNPHQLGKKAERLVTKHPIVYFSAISVAEVNLKAMLGKLKMDFSWLNEAQQQHLTALPFTNNHALEMSRFGSLAGHDPFDRMILAQAASEQIELLTADRKLLELGFPWIIDARS